MTAHVIAFTQKSTMSSAIATPGCATTRPDDEIFAGVVAAFAGYTPAGTPSRTRLPLATVEEALTERQRLYDLFDKLAPNDDAAYTHEALCVLQTIEEFPHPVDYIVSDDVYAAYRAVRRAEITEIRRLADAELDRPS